MWKTLSCCSTIFQTAQIFHLYCKLFFRCVILESCSLFVDGGFVGGQGEVRWGLGRSWDRFQGKLGGLFY
jgi:hypothetical protein